MAFWIFLEVLQYITIPYYLFILKLILANKKKWEEEEEEEGVQKRGKRVPLSKFLSSKRSIRNSGISFSTFPALHYKEERDLSRNINIRLIKRKGMERKELLEGGNGVEKDVNPLELCWGCFLRIVWWEAVRNGACSVICFDRRQ